MAQGYNEKQLKMLLAMIEQSASQNIKYDWQIIADKAGYGSAASATSQWQKLKAKLREAAGETSAATPSKGTKKRKSEADGGEDGSPTTKKTKTATKSKDDNAGLDKIEVKEEGAGDDP